MRKLLMVSRNFPPAGGVCVERVTKFAKYLPSFGWRPTVLTGRRGEYGLRHDEHLARDVASVPVIRCAAPDPYALAMTLRDRARAGLGLRNGAVRRRYRPPEPWHPKAWVVPDSQLLWTPVATRAALRAARGETWDAVYATIGPPTNAVVAHRIAERLRRPLVLDYRDSWTRAFFSARRPGPLAEMERRLEERIYAAASAIVALDPSCVARPALGAPGRPPVHIIPNGYDEEDYRAREPVDLPRFSIVHTGSLNSERHLAPLWRILERFLSERPSWRGRMQFWQIGTIDTTVQSEMGSPPEGVTVRYVPPVTLREALGWQAGADLLVVIAAGVSTPGKIYQYLRSARPLLVLTDRGGEHLGKLTALAPHGCACPRDDAETAAGFLSRLAGLPRMNPAAPGEGETDPAIARFSRRLLAGRLAEVLEGVVTEPGA